MGADSTGDKPEREAEGAEDAQDEVDVQLAFGSDQDQPPANRKKKEDKSGRLVMFDPWADADEQGRAPKPD
ncbi:hypothetical protein AB0H77_15605 [Streptomyces sp. NPDC050844]|uniref:hypothetical protein n=1 Tax=Streptomyces sp. NPDC050844 TaxID=3155790 RepID=UPI0033D07861